MQHIALKCDDIITVVEALRARGVTFLNIPDAYYDNLRKGLANSSVRVQEDIDIIQKNKILIDYDE